MELVRFGPDDDAAVRHYLDIEEAGREVDCPWEHESTYANAVGYLRHGWDGDVPESFLVEADGDVVGYANWFVNSWDNQHLAWMSLHIHPEHRRRGHGSAVLEAMLARARSEGKRTLGDGTRERWHSEAATSPDRQNPDGQAGCMRSDLPSQSRRRQGGSAAARSGRGWRRPLWNCAQPSLGAEPVQ